MADDLVQSKLRRLADRFLGSLAGDMARLRPASYDDAARAEVRLTLHRLAGRAGTFGFTEIGVKASRLEALILDGRWPSDEFAAALSELETLSSGLVSPKP